jgi:Tfp pilus assembly protein PilF
MLTPRNTFSSRLTTALLLFVCLLMSGSDTSVKAQQQSANSTANERGRGISLYQQGRDQEAIEAIQSSLKHQEDDVVAWHYLGLAKLSLSRPQKTGNLFLNTSKLNMSLRCSDCYQKATS